MVFVSPKVLSIDRIPFTPKNLEKKKKTDFGCCRLKCFDVDESGHFHTFSAIESPHFVSISISLTIPWNCLMPWRSSHNNSLNACSSPFDFNYFFLLRVCPPLISFQFPFAIRLLLVKNWRHSTIQNHKSLWCDANASKAVNKLISWLFECVAQNSNEMTNTNAKFASMPFNGAID